MFLLPTNVAQTLTERCHAMVAVAWIVLHGQQPRDGSRHAAVERLGYWLHSFLRRFDAYYARYQAGTLGPPRPRRPRVAPAVAPA
ncbi:MAG: hypothetical protein JOY70_09950, partial [Acidisphaera sp.]|nr:hypothetical protein [Acidisphaera sp.]